MKNRLFVLVLLFMLCSTNVCAETSTRYTLDEIGMSISFPKDFDVFTRNMPDDSQVFLDYDLNSKEVNEILIPNNIYLLALSEDGNKEIDVAMTDNSISDFSKFSDNVLNTMASMLIEEYKKAGVVIEKYDIYHSGYITYVRMWERYNDMPNHIALQYYTVHECQAINIIMHSFNGGITAADEITMLDIVNGVVFGDRKDSTVVYKTSTDPTHFSYEILSDGTAKITGYMGLQASISIPESIDGHVITSIGKMDKNYTVSTVFIPATVKSMEGNPFVDLSVLKAIDVDEKNTSYIAEDGVLYTYDKKELVCYPKNRKNETFVVPSETDIVGENAFNNVYLFYVELSEGVEVIEQDAFAHAVGITNIYLPKTIKRIDGNPFDYSPSLMSISVDPKNPYFYAQDGVLFNRSERMLQAFPDNKAIEHYTIPEGIISVGEDAFNNHSGNATITFPKSLRKIGAWAFDRCSGFEFPELTSNLIQIDEFAFDGCNTIESVKIHSDAIIGKRAFGDCGGLKSVYIEEGITEVSDYMFFACESLQEVELPSTLASIGEHAFRMCESLEILTIPASVEYIGERAFDDCSKLVIQVKEGSYAAQ